MRHSGAIKAVPFRRLLQMRPKNAAFFYMEDPTDGSFAAQPIPECIFHTNRQQYGGDSEPG